MQGIVISFAGIDGTGKSTQADRAAVYVEEAFGREVVRSSAISDHCTDLGIDIGGIMKDPDNDGIISAETECLLMLAARRQTHDEVIKPALDRGAVVISDRFKTCMAIYQDIQFAVADRRLREFGLYREADLEFVFAAAPTTAMKRLDPEGNRLERRTAREWSAMQRRYLQRAAGDIGNHIVVNANKDIDTVWGEVKKGIDELLGVE